MRLDDFALTTSDRGTQLSGSVDGEPIWWEVGPGIAVEARGEPFICAMLPAAMHAGKGITLPDVLPVDPTFMANIDRLQAIFSRWFPGHGVVPIRATIAAAPPRKALRATGYSGGVDSSYSVDVLGTRLDAVVLIDGIEYRQDRSPLFEDIEARLGAAMQRRGLELLLVRTNVKTFGRHLGAKWSVALGGAVASAAHVVGATEYHVAASNSWENLRPYGSHPLTDPLWSSAVVQIDHHGAELPRIEKIRYLGNVPDLLDELRVCFQGTAYNCGTCHKCLMTAAALRALGLRSAAMPELEDPSPLRSVFIEHAGDLVDWAEILIPGVDARDPELARPLRQAIRRHRWREVARVIDDLTTGGRLRGALRARAS